MRDIDNDFIKEVEKQLLERLGEEYDTKIQKVVKNNGIVQDGLCIIKEGDYLAPTIGLEVFFEKYKRTGSIAGILSDIEAIYNSRKKLTAIEPNHFMEFEQIKGRVAYKLVNTKANMELLKSIPHFEFLDLSIIFYLYLNDSRYGGMTAVIHNQHLNVWEISEGKLYDLAKKNTPVLFPAEIRTMCDVMAGYVKDQVKDGETEAEGIEEVLNQMKDENVKVPFYILSNRMGLNGACTILYHNVLKDFADKNKTDLAILPSSVHEVLLLPCNDKTDFVELKAMVKCVNQTEVRIEDWLSDTVYYYCREDDRIFETDSLEL